MVAAAMMAVLLVFGPSLDGEAYRRPDSSVCTAWSALRWKFTNPGAASSTDLATFRANVDDWNTLDSYDGNPFMSSVESTTSVNVNVEWQNDVTPNTDCVSSTVLRTIYIDPLDPDSYIAYAAAHEAGHAHGMRHTGAGDNLTPDGAATFPLMGCGPQLSYPNDPRGDDVAQAFTRFGVRATPNWGFENGANWWTRSSTTGVVTTTSNVYSGTTSMLMAPGTWIKTRVRVAEPGLHRMVAAFRGDASASGTVRFLVQVYPVTYATWPIPADGCPALNSATLGSLQTPLDQTRSVSTTWQTFSQDLAAISGGSQGVQATVLVYNNTTTNVRIDNVALEER